MPLPSVYSKQIVETNANTSCAAFKSRSDIERMPNGIVFVLARWSGSSQLAFRALTNALKMLDEKGRPTIYILDTDEDSTALFFESVGDQPTGSGETYWILNGNIVGRMRGYEEDEMDKVIELTRKVAG